MEVKEEEEGNEFRRNGMGERGREGRKLIREDKRKKRHEHTEEERCE